MIAVHPVRTLLRAKDLIDARYREPLGVLTLALRRTSLRRNSAESPAAPSARRRTSIS